MMNQEDFISAIYRKIVNDNLRMYQNEIFTPEAFQDSPDINWQKKLSLIRSFDKDQREVFFQILRHVIVDTLSGVFAILDGVTMLRGQEGDFQLFLEGKEISGDLQDLFLEMEENI